MKLILSTLACALLTVIVSPARAATVDASTVTCESLNNGVEKKNLKYINGILNWMGGYHATEAQGTVVDFKKLSGAFNKTIAYCAEHPAVGVMSASEKFMGEHIEEAGSEALDVAIITCGNVLDGKVNDIGDTFMWLDGYHTSTKKDSTMLDFTKLEKNIGDIVDYCAAHKEVGLFTASEKFMGEEN